MRGFLARLLDIYRHYGEYPTQRQYRRYLNGIDHARRIVPQPYVLSTVKEVRPVTDETYWRERVLAQRVPMVREEAGVLCGAPSPAFSQTVAARSTSDPRVGLPEQV